jgi:putative transposase
MARPLRIAYEGALYHLTSRGNEKQPIFRSDSDRSFFLHTFLDVVERFKWKCYAFCLMDNHYHLMVETLLANVSQGMRQLNSVYSGYFNRVHKRVGHLFQGRFKGILVEKESHGLELCRYVVLNPVRAGMCQDARDYPWSSYQATMGIVSTPSFLDTSWVLQQFGSNPVIARARYERFVREGVGHCPWDELKGQIYLGSDAFIAELQARNEEYPEIPKIQLQPIKPALSELIQTDEGMLNAYWKHNYKIAEIADCVGVHYATICRRLQRIRDK